MCTGESRVVFEVDRDQIGPWNWFDIFGLGSYGSPDANEAVRLDRAAGKHQSGSGRQVSPAGEQLLDWQLAGPVDDHAKSAFGVMMKHVDDRLFKVAITNRWRCDKNLSCSALECHRSVRYASSPMTKSMQLVNA